MQIQQRDTQVAELQQTVSAARTDFQQAQAHPVICTVVLILSTALWYVSWTAPVTIGVVSERECKAAARIQDGTSGTCVHRYGIDTDGAGG